LSAGSQTTEKITIYQRATSVVTRTIAGETLLIPVRGAVGDLASIFSFNATATTIWESLDQPKRFDEIVQVVEQEYNVTEVQATSDVQVFLEELRSAGLVTVNDRALQGQAVDGDR